MKKKYQPIDIYYIFFIMVKNLEMKKNSCIEKLIPSSEGFMSTLYKPIRHLKRRGRRPDTIVAT